VSVTVSIGTIVDLFLVRRLSVSCYTCPGGIKNPLQASISILPIIGFRPVKISRETMINVTEKGE
jgi:hypothetical protein